MRWRRRRSPAPAGTSTELVLAPHLQRALVALATHAHQIEGSLDRLERRLEDAAATAEDAPTHADLLDVRLHSARVAAELARVTVELRAEIEGSVRAADSPREQRLRTLAE